MKIFNKTPEEIRAMSNAEIYSFLNTLVADVAHDNFKEGYEKGFENGMIKRLPKEDYENAFNTGYEKGFLASGRLFAHER